MCSGQGQSHLSLVPLGSHRFVWMAKRKKLPKQLKHSPNSELGFCVIRQLPLMLKRQQYNFNLGVGIQNDMLPYDIFS